MTALDALPLWFLTTLYATREQEEEETLHGCEQVFGLYGFYVFCRHNAVLCFIQLKYAPRQA